MSCSSARLLSTTSDPASLNIAEYRVQFHLPFFAIQRRRRKWITPACAVLRRRTVLRTRPGSRGARCAVRGALARDIPRPHAAAPALRKRGGAWHARRRGQHQSQSRSRTPGVSAAACTSTSTVRRTHTTAPACATAPNQARASTSLPSQSVGAEGPLRGRGGGWGWQRQRPELGAQSAAAKHVAIDKRASLFSCLCVAYLRQSE